MKYFSDIVTKSIHTKELPLVIYADKGYCEEPNGDYLSMNGMGDGIMRKNQINAVLTEAEIQRNKEISKLRCNIVSTLGSRINIMEPGRRGSPPLSKSTGIISAPPWPSTSSVLS